MPKLLAEHALVYNSHESLRAYVFYDVTLT